jgi:hypothetical protein
MGKPGKYDWERNPEPTQREFFHLDAHEGRHSMTIHRWNPYWYRRFTPALDRDFFDAMNFVRNGHHTSPDLAFMGCLDAPEDIPLGGTACIQTVGGYAREEYLNAPRDCDDWGRRLRAERETGEMLKKILAEAEAADQAG